MGGGGRCNPGGYEARCKDWARTTVVGVRMFFSYAYRTVFMPCYSDARFILMHSALPQISLVHQLYPHFATGLIRTNTPFPNQREPESSSSPSNCHDRYEFQLMEETTGGVRHTSGAILTTFLIFRHSARAFAAIGVCNTPVCLKRCRYLKSIHGTHH